MAWSSSTLTSLTVSDVVESLGTVVFDAVSRSESERLDEGFLLVLPVYFRILHNEYRQRAVPVLPSQESVASKKGTFSFKPAPHYAVDAGDEEPIFNSYTCSNVQPPVTSGAGRAGPLTTGLKRGSEKRRRYLCTLIRLAQTVSKWTYWPPLLVTKGRTLPAIDG